MGRRVSLKQLYARGEHVRIEDDETGNWEVVWVRPISTPEKEIAARFASARRASYLAARKNPTEDQLALAARDVIEKEEWDPEFCVQYLLATKCYDKVQAAEAELSLTEEWRKDGYLLGLRDAWEGVDGEPGLKERRVTEPGDPRAEQVFTELKRFDDAVEERVRPFKEAIERELRSLDIDALYERATIQVLEERAEVVWSEEFLRCRMWKGTMLCEGSGDEKCTDDHRTPYFTDRVEVDELIDKPTAFGEPRRGAFIELRDAHQRLNVDVVEGKGSPAQPSSSSSSDPPIEEATEASSGLVDANA